MLFFTSLLFNNLYFLFNSFYTSNSCSSSLFFNTASSKAASYYLKIIYKILIINIEISQVKNDFILLNYDFM